MGTTQKQKMGRSLFERLYKKSYFKACEGYKTATDAACESRECLNSMPSSEEEKPLLWVNLLSVNAIAYEQCLRQRENSCKRMQRQIYLHYAECSRIRIKSTLVPQRSAAGFEGECNDKRAFLVSLFYLLLIY